MPKADPKLRFLIVDDEKDTIDLILHILNKEFSNACLETASSGEKATALIKEYQYDIIILDVFLEDMTGFDISKVITKKHGKPKVLCITQYNCNIEELAVQKGAEEFDAFLKKPFSHKKLVQNIKDLIKLASIESEFNKRLNIFVAMPFRSDFHDVYKFCIESAAKKLNIDCIRLDHQIFTSEVIQEIKKSIIKADFVVADISGGNANVCYEVGFAHAKRGKKVVLISNSIEDTPFDIQSFNIYEYDRNNLSEFYPKLHRIFSELKQNLILNKTKS